jgi:hypothetical protein
MMDKKKYANHSGLQSQRGKKKSFNRQLKIGPAFWTIASIISLTVNIFLLIILISLGRHVFEFKKVAKDQLVAGLYRSFILMDQARIKTTIPVETTVPARFDLPLETDTIVVLTEDTLIDNARVTLNTGGLFIQSAPTDITLPAGTRLPVHLELVVPVEETIPVNIDVDVDIPIQDTELHEAIIGLQQVVSPYYELLEQIPDSWDAVFSSIKIFDTR